MFRTAFAAAFCLSAATSAASAAGIDGVTADGAWDCVDMAGAAIGTVVVASDSYAFIGLDNKVEAYGTLMRSGEEYWDLPSFVVLDGYLHDSIGASGLSMKGPRGHEMDYSGDLFLVIGIAADNTPYCARRAAPAA